MRPAEAKPCLVLGCRSTGCIVDGYPEKLCLVHHDAWQASGEYRRADEQFMDEVAFEPFSVARNDWVRRVVAETQNAGNGQ